MTDPTPTPIPPSPPAPSNAASRAVLITAVLAMIGLGVAAWLLAASPDTAENGQVGDAASGPSEPTQTSDTPNLEAKVERYVALGDSMTSAPFLPEVDRADGCFRSSQNYPSLIADELQIPNFVDVSCGGATTEDMRGAQIADVPPQLDAVTADADLVTLTLGGNDFGTYRNIVIGCRQLAVRDPGGSPCRDAATEDGGDFLVERIEQIGPRLESVLDEIHARAPDALVVMLGYPRLLPTSGTCPSELPFAAGDYSYLASVMQRFKQVQRAAAEATDTEFIDMHEISEGHDPCSQDPWMNGQTAVPSGAAAFHPFPAAQSVMAEEVMALTK